MQSLPPARSSNFRKSSYVDAQRQAQQLTREQNAPVIHNPYSERPDSSGGNFRQKMKQSQEEAERLRLKCREAAIASAARTQQEEMQRHIEEARAAAQANSLHHMEKKKQLQSEMSRSLLPSSPQEDEEEAAAFGNREVLLPGALEPFEVTTKPEEPPPQSEKRNSKTKPPEVQMDEATGKRKSSKTKSGELQAQDSLTGNLPRSGTADGGLTSTGVPSAMGDTMNTFRTGSAATAQPEPVETSEAPADAFADVDDPIIADDKVKGEIYDDEDKQSSRSRSGSKSGSQSESSSGSFISDESEESDQWPPNPPVLRFKMQMQFSNRFKPSEGKALFEEMNKDLEERMIENKTVQMKDPTVGWINLVFSMKIETEYQFEVGFPIIVLTMLDAIYPKRVRWREVDWGFQYKRALQKNFAVLETIWSEVNMEKAREFRVENTPLRLENMGNPDVTVKEKLEFVRLMKRWFDQRIHHAGPYDPVAKRHEFVSQCKAWGHTVKFPPWIEFDKKEAQGTAVGGGMNALIGYNPKKKAFDSFPEYKRLIWFLGSPEYQTM